MAPRRGPRYISPAIRAREAILARPRWAWGHQAELWLVENIGLTYLTGVLRLSKLTLRYWRDPDQFMQ